VEGHYVSNDDSSDDIYNNSNAVDAVAVYGVIFTKYYWDNRFFKFGAI
jgi:hypothetical protein